MIGFENTWICVDLSVRLYEAVKVCPDAVFLTHEHIDHVYGLPSFLHQSWIAGRTKPLDIYIPDGAIPVAEGMIELFGLRQKKGMFEIRVIPVALAGKAALETAGPIRIGTMKITPFKTDHTASSMGLMLEAQDGEEKWKIVFTSDTRPIPGVPEFMRNADVLIHDASGTAETEELLVKKGHSSDQDARELAGRICAKELILTHRPVSDSYPNRSDQSRKKAMECINGFGKP